MFIALCFDLTLERRELVTRRFDVMHPAHRYVRCSGAGDPTELEEFAPEVNSLLVRILNTLPPLAQLGELDSD